MHELALMEALRERALEQAERHGGGTIRAITMRVGSLAGVELEALELAFAVVMEREGPEGAAPVQPITTADYPTPARRPSYSLLDCGASRAALGLEPVHWRAALAQVLADASPTLRPSRRAA